MRKLLSSILLVCLFSLFILPICYSYTDASFIWTEDTSTVSISIATDLQLESESSILIEQNSGKVLYEHNSHEQLRPASVTKVMSILLIMEALDNETISLNTKIPCSENASSMGRLSNLA